MEDVPQPSDLRSGPFISYAREDQDFVRKLHDALLRRGRNAWIDWEIFPSAEWMREVRNAIDAAPSVVFLISPDSIASSVCRQELDYALAQNKRLVPVVCRDVDTDNVDVSVRKLNWIYVLDPDELDQKVEQLCEVMDVDLDWLHAHTRLLMRARDWEIKGRDPSLLLYGNDLKEFEQWLVKIGDDRMPRSTALQLQYVIVSRRAQTTRQRYVLSGVGIALIVTVVLAIYALIQSRIAEHQRDVALSRLLAAASLKNMSDVFGQLDLALLLSVAANQSQPTLEAQNSLFRALDEANRIKRFVPTAGTLVSLAVSPDGSMIATGGFDGEIVLWDAKTLQTRATMQQGKSKVNVVQYLSFSPDGRTLASVSGERIVLWDVLSGQERRMLPLPGGRGQVAWRPDGTMLFSGSLNEPFIFLWDAATGIRRSPIRVDDRNLTNLAVSPDGKTMASVEFGKNGITLWDVATGKEQKILQGHQGSIKAIGFSPDGTLLASGGQDAIIIIWEVTTGTQRMTLKGHTERVDCVAFSHDGKRLASGSNNRTIMLWDLMSGKPFELLRGHTNGLLNVVFTPDDKALVSNAFDDTFMVWNLGMPGQRARLSGHEADVRAVAITPDGATLASGSDDGTIRLWDAASGQERAVLKGHRGEVRTMAFSPDGRRLASGADHDRRIIFWDVKSGRQLKEIDGDESNGSIRSVAFSSDGRSLASGAGLTYSIVLWDVATGEQQSELLGHESNVSSLEFSRDGKGLVSVDEEGAIRVWDLSTRKEIQEPMGGRNRVAKVAISPDGRTLASSTHYSDTLILWELYGSKDPVELDTAGLSDTPLAYSPDEKTLAYTSGEVGFNIVLWDMANGRPRATLEGSATTLSMAFTPDGRRLVTGHSGGTVTLWDVDVETWPRRACEIANRNFTPNEWKRFVGEDLPYRAACPELPVPKD